MRDADRTKEQLIDELMELRRRNAEPKQSGAEVWDRTRDLDKRIRELNCIYAIFHLVEKREIPLEDLLQWTVDLIPGAWQYPEITCARIILESQDFRTENFKETTEKQTSDVIVGGDRRGILEVCYLEERPERDEGPFAKEERSLLNAIADQLGRMIERKWMAEALRESERKLQLIAENMTDVIFAYDMDRRLSYVNPAFETLTGYTTKELYEQNFINYLHPDDEERMMQMWEDLFQGKGFPGEEFRIVTKDGQVKWCLSSWSPLLDEEGRQVGIQGWEVDITERKRMEEELLKIQKLESIGVLAGGIAHDLNNLLTVVIGNISLARMYENPADKDRRLVEAEQASMRIKDLTQQLLTFSRGGAPILQTAAIGDLLRNSATFTLRGSNVRCEFSIPDDLWPVEVDEGQMSQVINNLIINSQQAMPTGGIVKIRAENATVDAEHGLPIEAGAYIQVSVEDEGIGVPEEHIQKIFDPFFTTKQAGNGLGLATSYSIIQKHHGHITVESQLGIGTTFYIYLPASPEEILTKKGEEEEAPIMGEGKILVMDDEKHVRDTAAEMLSSIGYKVITSVDGAEAIEMYKEAKGSGEPYDAVIIDLTIPGGMGGGETIQQLMEIDPQVKAIVSSGYSNDPILANFRDYGFKGVIAKPYETREMSEVLHRVIMGINE